MLAISIAVATGLALLLPSLMPRGKRASPQQVVQMINRGKTVVVVCQTGARVDKAIKQLQGAGFDDVVGLDGGLTAWRAANLPTAK